MYFLVTAFLAQNFFNLKFSNRFFGEFRAVFVHRIPREIAEKIGLKFFRKKVLRYKKCGPYFRESKPEIV